MYPSIDGKYLGVSLFMLSFIGMNASWKIVARKSCVETLVSRLIEDYGEVMSNTELEIAS